MVTRVIIYLLAIIGIVAYPIEPVGAQLIPGRIGGVFNIPWQAPTTPTDCSTVQYGWNGDMDTGLGYDSANVFSLCSGGGLKVSIGTNVSLNTSLLFLTDNTNDIGNGTTNDPRNVFAQGKFQTDGNFVFTSSSILKAPANGQLNLLNNAETVGVGLDFGSLDAELKIRTRAQSAYANVRAAQYGFGSGSMSEIADAKVKIMNAAGTAGAVLDVSTDALAKLRNRADSAYANFDLGTLYFSAGSRLTQVSDGIIQAQNNAGTGFTRLILGTNDSSGSAIVKSSTTLQMKTGDANNYVAVEALQYQATAANITLGAGTGISVITQGLLQRQVYKVTVDRTAFVCAATTCDVTPATLPTKTTLVAVYGELTTTFACTATCTSSTLSLQLGTTGGGTQILASIDADAAAAVFGDVDAELGTNQTRAVAVQAANAATPNFSSTTGINLRLTSGTGNIGNGAATNLSQGSITFYLVTERLP